MNRTQFLCWSLPGRRYGSTAKSVFIITYDNIFNFNLTITQIYSRTLIITQGVS